MILCITAGFLPGVDASVHFDDVSAVDALCGKRGYGDRGMCIQEPGAQGGAYIYAGSAMPYEEPDGVVAVPDSFDVVFVNHVGRHGARFLSSDKEPAKLLKFLKGRDGLTPVGQRIYDLCEAVDSVTGDRWGALDALGRKELSGIGERFAVRYGGLLSGNERVEGFSSYVPRCIMSMDEMTHGIAWHDRSVELSTGSGKRFNALVRPFEVDSAYLAYKNSGEWKRVYEGFVDTVCPPAVALRLSKDGSAFLERLCKDALKRGVPNSGASLEQAIADTLNCAWPSEWEMEAGMTRKEALSIAGSLYKVVAGCQAIEYGENVFPQTVSTYWGGYFTSMEYEKLWECANLEHYLTYSASGFSDAPAQMARPLLAEILETLEEAATSGYNSPAAIVRFGHAETLMPLLALMDLPGCRYVTTDWGSVANHWQDWNVVPMGANLQLVLCRAHESGELYLITYRNEEQAGAPEPWAKALQRLQALTCGE